jgi:hypothetical protein
LLLLFETRRVLNSFFARARARKPVHNPSGYAHHNHDNGFKLLLAGRGVAITARTEGSATDAGRRCRWNWDAAPAGRVRESALEHAH